MTVKIYIGDCRQVLKTLPSNSVHVTITSPPYYGLRSYGVGIENGEIGLEETPQEYVDKIVEVFRGVWRVLREDGCVFLNLGDSYAGSGAAAGGNSKQTNVGSKGRWHGGPDSTKNRHHPPTGLKEKDLCGIPWRVALALQADGWYLRSAMPWVKGNCMPESVQDRPTTAHEYIFLLTKSARYFYDGEAVKIPSIILEEGRKPGTRITHPEKAIGPQNRNGHSQWESGIENLMPSGTGRNRRTSDTFRESLDVRIQQQRAYLAHLEHVRDNGGMLTSETGNPVAMLVNTRGFSGAHFAVFPPDLVKPMIAAGTSERGCCPECGAPWVRVVERKTATPGQQPGYNRDSGARNDGDRAGSWIDAQSKTIGWKPTCTCNAGDPVPCLVFDLFGGSGTTALQADRMGRDAIIIDLNETYIRELAYPRIAGDAPLFSDVEIIEKEN